MNTIAHTIRRGCALLCLFACTAPAQRITFQTLPTGWTVRKKLFTNASVFEIHDDPSAEGHRWLSATSDNASATLTSDTLLDIDLNKTPILRWRWRATVLPHGGDGRNPKKDDQAIGLYINSGSRFKQQSIAYRWETKTPAGSEGTVQYAKIIAVKWFAVRDENHTDGKTFFIEERNLAEDFKQAFGTIPDRIGIGICCNSQYTGTRSEAQLDWIEFAEQGTQPNKEKENEQQTQPHPQPD